MTTAHLTIRPGVLSDLPRLTDIHNHYVLNTHIVFDVRPYKPEERVAWFLDHCDGRRYRLLVAEDAQAGVLGYTCSGRFRPKEAYSTTVEVSIACSPDATGKGIGRKLYQALFAALASEDIHRIVAGIAQPNAASNALHERFGFQRIGTFSSVGRKFGKFWDVVWMERPLVLAEGAYRGLTQRGRAATKETYHGGTETRRHGEKQGDSDRKASRRKSSSP